MILDNSKTMLAVLAAHGVLLYGAAHWQRPQAEPQPVFLQAVPLPMGQEAAPTEPKPPAPLPKLKEKIQQVRQKVQEKIAKPTKPVVKQVMAATPERAATLEVAAAKEGTKELKELPAPAPSEQANTGVASAGREGKARDAEPVLSAPSFHANYLNNPKPPYPPASRALGEQGLVRLKVVVNPDGLPSKVEVDKSSGFQRLDAVAEATVKKWRFVPAKRGDEAVVGTVIVPMNFSLEKS